MGQNLSYRIFADRLDSARPRQHLIDPGLKPRANTNPCVSPSDPLAENIPSGRDLFLSPAEYLAQRAETLVECALRGAGVLFHDLELDRHHAQRKRNERALFMRQLDGPNVAAADFAEWPIIEKPLRAVIRFPSDAVTRFDCFASDSAEPDIVQHNPTPAPDAGCRPEQIKQRQRVPVIRVIKVTCNSSRSAICKRKVALRGTCKRISGTSSGNVSGISKPVGRVLSMTHSTLMSMVSTQLALSLPCRRASAAAIIPAEKPVRVPISITRRGARMLMNAVRKR